MIEGVVMWISKVHRQHNSLVITLRAGMCREIGIKHGDHVIFGQLNNAPDVVTMTKLTVKGKENEDTKHTDRKDKE